MRWTAPTLGLSVFYESRSGTITVQARSERANAVAHNVLSTLAHQRGLGVRSFGAASIEAATEVAERIGQLLDDATLKRLVADPSLLEQWAAAERDRDDILTDELVSRPWLARADAAWKERDFSMVVAAYRRVRRPLSELELKRVDYARRHSWAPGRLWAVVRCPRK